MKSIRFPDIAGAGAMCCAVARGACVSCRSKTTGRATNPTT